MVTRVVVDIVPPPPHPLPHPNTRTHLGLFCNSRSCLDTALHQRVRQNRSSKSVATKRWTEGDCHSHTAQVFWSVALEGGSVYCRATMCLVYCPRGRLPLGNVGESLWRKPEVGCLEFLVLILMNHLPLSWKWVSGSSFFPWKVTALVIAVIQTSWDNSDSIYVSKMYIMHFLSLWAFWIINKWIDQQNQCHPPPPIFTLRPSMWEIFLP